MFSVFDKNKTLERSNKWIFGTMLVFGVVGLVAAFVLSIEKLHLLQNPNAVLSCSFNLVLNCSTVMQTWQASVFGFPNSYIGLMTYPIVITVAVVGLAGATLPKWFWRTAFVFYGLGAIFAYWLFFNSVYVIEVLCPWCLAVTIGTTIIFGTIEHFMLRENLLGFSKQAHKKILRFLKADGDKVIIAGWLVLMVVLVFIKFGDSLFM